jgi:hypothetical protein
MVIVDSVDGCQQLWYRRVTGQRITPLRLVHRQGHDVLILLKLKEVWHVVILLGYSP